MIDTKKVRDRRCLRFENLDGALRDAENLAEAERRGSLRPVGNWTLGQTLGHLAFWADAPFDGYPQTPRLPWISRRLIPLLKNRFLNKGLPAGSLIPGAPEGTYGVELMPTEQGLDAVSRAYNRLARESPAVHNPVLGELSHENWIKLNLRHAELHLSFFHPQ